MGAINVFPAARTDARNKEKDCKKEKEITKGMYNGKFDQCLEIQIQCKDHDTCLQVTNTIKKQCDAWYFSVNYTEHKSARKGPVLTRTLKIYQTADAGDIVLFKESIRRICNYFQIFHQNIKYTDRGTEPANDLRKRFPASSKKNA